MGFFKVENPDKKIKVLMSTIQTYQGGNRTTSIYSSIPAEASVAAKKLCKTLKSLSVQKRELCDQNYWADFVDWYNTVYFGYFVNLGTMHAVINAMTDPKCLVKVANIRSYHDDICTSAIELIESQVLLQEILESYIEHSPLAYFQRSWSTAPDFRGGESLFVLLGKIDEEHFLAALKNRDKVPEWMQEKEINRYRYSFFGGNPYCYTIQDIVKRYNEKLNFLLQNNMINEKDILRYRQNFRCD